MWKFLRIKKNKQVINEEDLLMRSIKEKLKDYKNTEGPAHFSGPPSYKSSLIRRDMSLNIVELEDSHL